VRVQTAQAKGYTLEQIAEEAQQQGLDITAGTIRYALRSTGKGGSAVGVARPASGARAPGAEKVFTAQSRAQDATSQTKHVRKDGERRKPDRNPGQCRVHSDLRSGPTPTICRGVAMDTAVNPIYLVGGGKGGVGKSLVALALVDHFQRRGVKPVLVENDTSNPDVMKAVQGEIDCAAFDLDEADGWINFVNYCDEHRDAVVVVSTAARNQDGVARYGATLASTLGELGRRLVVFWVINRQRDSLELLRQFGETFPDATTHVVRNGHYGTPDRFVLYQDSKIRKSVEAKGSRSTFPNSRIVWRTICVVSACRCARRRSRCP
jgi:hypothetical protein